MQPEVDEDDSKLSIEVASIADGDVAEADAAALTVDDAAHHTGLKLLMLSIMFYNVYIAY